MLHSIPKTRPLSPVSEAHLALFQFLTTVVAEQHLSVTLRVAGGWVRDALLGIPSHDIDIAIETKGEGDAAPAAQVSGAAFAQQITQYQSKHQMVTRTLSVIRLNPEMSKHLETATMNIFDLPVEFCSLRKDEYGPESRVPTVAVATPKEDAERRDFTVNALFLNLKTMLIEDYTTGFEDLEKRLLRCPLSPRDTFLDDPLRVLRGVRFAGQLGFELDQEIFKAVDAQLVDALNLKVSRERVGIEVGKMFSCPRPAVCVKLLLDLKLLDSVILIERRAKAAPSRQRPLEEAGGDTRLSDTVANPAAALCAVRWLNEQLVAQLSAEGSVVWQDPADRLACLLFLVTVPFYVGASVDALQTRVYDLCVNGLKLPLAVYEGVRRMLHAHNVLAEEMAAACCCPGGRPAGPGKSNAVLDASNLIPGRSTVLTSLCAASTLSEATRNAIFKSSSVLHDRRAPKQALPLVVAAAAAMQWVASDKEADSASAEFQTACDAALGRLEGEKALLMAFTAALPFKGNELPALLGISNSEIGGALMEARRVMALSPCGAPSREDLLSRLRMFRETHGPFHV